MRRILLIDDTPEIAELLSFSLRDHGFDVFATGLSSLGAGSSKILGVVLNKVGTRAIEVNRSSASPITSKFIGRLKLLWSGAERRLEKE